MNSDGGVLEVVDFEFGVALMKKSARHAGAAHCLGLRQYLTCQVFLSIELLSSRVVRLAATGGRIG